MTNSLRHLIRNTIDYAGLFPPSKLPMEKAVANYIEYMTCHDSWMLSRFICPASKLTGFSKLYSETVKSGKQCQVSALGKKAGGGKEFLDSFQEDMLAIKQIQESATDRTVVDAFEVCLPPEMCSNVDELKTVLTSVSNNDMFQDSQSSQISIYFESVLDSSWKNEISSVVGAIANNNNLSIEWLDSGLSPAMGFKFRCGGVTAKQFPSVEQVTYSIKMCVEHSVALKLTAGLHHPFRHFNKSVDTKMHGFVNIFIAVLLCVVHNVDESTLSEVISDENSSNFYFNDDYLSWKEFKISIEEIVNCRKSSIISFGCCSFEEPRDDLRKLGLF